MSRITYDETMGSSDALIWHIEQDPQLRSTVMSVWLLERPPSPERMRSTVERMVNQLPRLRQRVIDDRPRPRWAAADGFDVDHHYRYDDLGGSKTQRRSHHRAMVAVCTHDTGVHPHEGIGKG